MFSRFPEIKFKRLDPDAPTPAYTRDGDVGLDLCAMEDALIPPGQYRKLGTGIAMEIPRGYVGIIHPRSGTGCRGYVLKHGAGIIDPNYRGEVQLPVLNNNTNEYIHVRKGDRVAQMLIHPVMEVTLTEVDELSESNRGEAGFGSSGMSSITKGPRP